ncbi:MAG: ACT domain-containing protein, partial [Planctomycetota bacterium]
NDIIQTEISADKANLSFMIEISDLSAAKEAVDQIKDEVNCESVFVRDDIAEVSVVGVGMRSHYGVAEKMFNALAEAQVNIDSITTSEIRISCAVDEEEAEKALEAVCVVFKLDKSAVQRSS